MFYKLKTYQFRNSPTIGNEIVGNQEQDHMVIGQNSDGMDNNSEGILGGRLQA
jgi:hypothetical protein